MIKSEQVKHAVQNNMREVRGQRRAAVISLAKQRLIRNGQIAQRIRSRLFRLKAGRISSYSVSGAPDGSDTPIFAVHRSRDGTLRAGSQAGLLRYENDATTST